MDEDLKKKKYIHDKIVILQDLRKITIDYFFNQNILNEDEEKKIIDDVDKLANEINDLIKEAKDIHENYR
jgi:argininosuccinate lyase